MCIRDRPKCIQKVCTNNIENKPRWENKKMIIVGENTMIQRSSVSKNDSHKKHSCRNNGVYKMYKCEWCVPSWYERERLLNNDNNDNENNNRSMCKTQCPKIIAIVNSIYTEILIDTIAELLVINHKFTSKNKQKFKQSPIHCYILYKIK